MGNTRSEPLEIVEEDPWWRCDDGQNSTNSTMATMPETKNDTADANSETVSSDLSSLHEKRIKLISEKKKEMNDLREEVERLKRENEQLRWRLPEQRGIRNEYDVGQQTDTFEVPGHDRRQLEAENAKLKTKIYATRTENQELRRNVEELEQKLQAVNEELAAYDNERREYKTHVTALKDIIMVSKQLLLMRESQIKELSQKVNEIQASLAEREFQTLSDDLRQEYERQLRNIKQLKVLYEERQKADKAEKDTLKSQLDEAKTSLNVHETKNTELAERVEELEKENWSKYDTISSLESQIGLSKAECAELQAEIGVINQLFSQILLGINNGNDINLDDMIKLLQENHDLLTDIVINEECAQASSALPKVLLDLVKQVSDKAKQGTQDYCDVTLPTIVEESESQTSTPQNSLNSASEIVQNLPKVWRVLAELLSHQSGPVNVLDENSEQNDKNPCYKSVQTPSGPTLVLSVSKTFIRLKNLIVEKKSLEKETMRLKQLNTHLETRLQDQEKRLSTVSDELSKTWHVVGKMQKQHQQLHTQEKILRYELAQKRKLLNELKEELEYCREKWLQAREKNSITEKQWKRLRLEFASRKNDAVGEDLNNSIESGYSDERESSSGEDDYDTEPSTLSVVSPETSEPSAHILEVIQDEIAKIEAATTDPIGMEVVVSTEHSNLEEPNSVIPATFPPEEGRCGGVRSVETLSNDETCLVENSAEPKQPEIEQATSTKLDKELRRSNSEPSECKQKDIVDNIYKKLEEDILQTIKKTQNGEEYPSTSKQKRTTEEILAAREERLKRLEAESNQLVDRTTKTSNRSIEISSKLDRLHQQYGNGEDGKGEVQETIREEEKVSDSATESNTSISVEIDVPAKSDDEQSQQLEEETQQTESAPREVRGEQEF